jgi:hypothetical protein
VMREREKTFRHERKIIMSDEIKNKNDIADSLVKREQKSRGSLLVLSACVRKVIAWMHIP